MNSEFLIAVHALVFLYHKQEVVASDVLAENVCTNPVCIRKVMGKLKKAGLVDTKEGASGGYRLCRDGADCTLHSVGEALGTEFVKATWTSGNADKECMICSGVRVGERQPGGGKLVPTAKAEPVGQAECAMDADGRLG